MILLFSVMSTPDELAEGDFPFGDIDLWSIEQKKEQYTNKSVSNRFEINKKLSPQIAILTLKEDGESPEQFPTRIAMMEENLSEGKYEVNHIMFSSLPEICAAIEKINSKGPIFKLVFRTHGNPMLVSLGETGVFDIYDYFSNQIDLPCFKSLPHNITIILSSCHTSDDHWMRINDTGYYVYMNMHRLFALLAPGSIVYSPNYEIGKIGLFQNQTGAYGIDFNLYQKEVVNYYGDDEKLKPAEQYDDLCHLDNCELEQNSLRALNVISPDNAIFCHDVLPYYTMKSYCDYAKRFPYTEDLESCLNDIDCKKAIEILESKNIQRELCILF